MIIMPRKSAEFWWVKINKRIDKIPSNVACYSRDNSYEKWKTTTWEDVHKKRTEKIKANILDKRRHEKIVTCLVWVFSHGFWIMGGYYTIIKTVYGEYYLNFKNINISTKTTAKKLKLKVMRLFPLCFPLIELFDNWMKLFAIEYNNQTFYQGWKNQGVAIAYCKIDKYGDLIDLSGQRTKLL